MISSTNNFRAAAIFGAILLAFGAMSGIATAQTTDDSDSTDTTNTRPRILRDLPKPVNLLKREKAEANDDQRAPRPTLYGNSETAGDTDSAPRPLERARGAFQGIAGRAASTTTAVREQFAAKREEMLQKRDDLQQLREEREQKREEFKAKVQERVSERAYQTIQHMDQRLNNVIEKLTAALERIVEIAANLSDRGVDTGSIDGLITAARSAIATAQADVAAAHTAIETASASDTPREHIGDIRTAMQTAVASIKAAHKAVKDAAGTLKELARSAATTPNPSDEADTESDTSTE